MTVIVQDSFTDIDNTSLSNHITDTGHSWTVAGAGTAIIKNNQATVPSNGDNFATVDVGLSDVIVSVKLTIKHGWSKLIWRFIDSSNYYRWENGNIYKKVGGSQSTLASTSYASDGDILSVRIDGNVHTFYINGVEQATFTDTFNQTVTKHGIGLASTTGYFDDFQLESLGTTEEPVGEDGSTAFDLRQSIYSDGTLSYDLTQRIYADMATSFDTRFISYQDAQQAHDMRAVMYQDSVQSYDTKQLIYEASAVHMDTQQVIYEVASTAFDMIQEYYQDGQTGSTPFDMRIQLYEDNTTLFDSRQEWYSDGYTLADLQQAIYESGKLDGDVRLILYADSAMQTDMLQTLYTDGAIDFDTLQQLLNEWTDYREVIRITLNITRNQTATLEFVRRKQSELKM